MPYFDIDEAMKYAGEKIDADVGIDLADLDADSALAELEKAFSERAESMHSMVIRFPPASEGSGETLFQPVGRWLLAQRKAGRISKLENLLSLGTGFYVEF
jgi:hypothetical protein